MPERWFVTVYYGKVQRSRVAYTFFHVKMDSSLLFISRLNYAVFLTFYQRTESLWGSAILCLCWPDCRCTLLDFFLISVYCILYCYFRYAKLFNILLHFVSVSDSYLIHSNISFRFKDCIRTKARHYLHSLIYTLLLDLTPSRRSLPGTGCSWEQ